MKYLRILTIFVVYLLNSTAFAKPDLPIILHIAATDWCPYSCSKQDGKAGIVNEYITQILNAEGIHIEIQTLPWSRAIKAANKGDRIQGLLTAIHEEAPDLLFTNVATMTFQNCFFANKNSVWRYVNENSLLTIPSKLGVIANYGYGEPIDGFINDQLNREKLEILSGEGATKRMMKMLTTSRITIALEERNVFAWEHKKIS